MSFWDDATNVWNGITNGDWSGAASSLGDAVGSGASAVADYGGQALDAITGAGNSAPSQAAGLLDNSAGALSEANPLAGLSIPDVAKSAGTMGGTFESGAAPGLAQSGGAGLLGQATDWAKRNPDLLSNGIKALGTYTNKTSPAPANTAAYNAASSGNAAKTAVGTSLVNQAPFLAQKAEAASKGAGANASSALNQRLTQQGYKPGDAMYESMMQQQQLGNGQNDATAYAAGQGQRANQEATGAGLMTPTNLSAYSDLGKDQNAQQSAENTKNADVAGLAKNAFDIWSNPDTAKKATVTPPV
jgi:hypothetical protein